MLNPNKNRFFLETALTANFISKAQCAELLNALKTEEQNGKSVSVVSLIETKNMLPPEDIQFLCELVSHMGEKQLDHAFGKLAVANQFITQAAIDRALAIQDEEFKTKKKTRKIGEILIESGEITEAQLWALLITQNRVRDNELISALQQLGDTELQKRNINKRFGAIAVSKKILTIEQVNQGLAMQTEEARSGKPKRFIGEILKDAFGISDEHIMEVLKEQKRLEVSGLKLEKRLSSINAEVQFLEKMDELFEERISDDKLEAYIKLKKGLTEAITTEQVKKWLSVMGIRFGVVEASRIDGFLASGISGSELKIALGESPKPGEEGAITYHFDTSVSDLSDEKKLKKEGKRFGKGEVIAVITPPQAGLPGKDVTGRIISPPLSTATVIWCGSGVRKEGNNFISEMDGYPVLYKGRTLLMLPADEFGSALPIQGDLNEEQAKNLSASHVIIEGAIPFGVTARCHHLTVNGCILGKVMATGDVVAKSGVGDAASSEDNIDISTSIAAIGKVTVGKHINRAEIRSSGSISAASSRVTTSRLSARNEIVLKEVHADDSKKVEIIIGIAEEGRIAEIEKEIEKHTLDLETLKSKDPALSREKQLNCSLQIQDKIRERQNVVKFISEMFKRETASEILDDKGLSDPECIEKMRSESSRQASASACPPVATKAYEYAKELVASLRQLSAGVRAEFLETTQKKGVQEYRAAVRATETAEAECQSDKQKDLSLSSVNETEFFRLENEIMKLCVERDRMNFSMERNAPTPARLKVKSKISRGVVVKGRNARMVIQNDLYGVTIREVQRHDKKWEMVIENYYQ